MKPGKGSHTGWYHPLVRGKVTLSGSDGDDAKAYQEDQVRVFLEKIQKAREQAGTQQ